jgi:hypothetical protein
MEVGTALKLGLAAGVLYLGYKLTQQGSALFNAIPQVVKDGALAGWTLGSYAAHTIADPLDAFGISPSLDASGSPTWTPTTPWETPAVSGYHDPVYGDLSDTYLNDPVSNNSSGMNYNYF